MPTMTKPLRIALLATTLGLMTGGCGELLYFGAGAIGSVLQLCEDPEDEDKARCR